jgi:hypothetical protein
MTVNGEGAHEQRGGGGPDDGQMVAVVSQLPRKLAATMRRRPWPPTGIARSQHDFAAPKPNSVVGGGPHPLEPSSAQHAVNVASRASVGEVLVATIELVAADSNAAPRTSMPVRGEDRNPTAGPRTSLIGNHSARAERQVPGSRQ